MILKAKDLDQLGPQIPGCGGGSAVQVSKNVKSKCHPSVPMTATYDTTSRVLKLTCGVCRDLAFEIEVAK